MYAIRVGVGLVPIEAVRETVPGLPQLLGCTGHLGVPWL